MTLMGSLTKVQALLTYVKNIEEELQKHNELRGAMLLAFSPRHPNSAKAMANWERKSSYLLREIVKFGTYIDCLTQAQKEKERVLGEKVGTKAVEVEIGEEKEKERQDEGK